MPPTNTETMTPPAVNTQDQGQEFARLLRAAANRPRAAARALLHITRTTTPPSDELNTGGAPCHP